MGGTLLMPVPAAADREEALKPPVSHESQVVSRKSQVTSRESRVAVA
jgi:hypothetical protein